MTNAEMLTRCHEIAAALPKDERTAFDYYRETPEASEYACTPGGLLALLVLALERDINAEECRAARAGPEVNRKGRPAAAWFPPGQNKKGQTGPEWSV